MNTKGFTLLELMIVIAIIAILAAIAIPTFQSYMIRARVADGLHRVANAQNAVADYQFTNNALPNSQAQTFYTTNPPDAYVETIDIGAAGAITITYTALAGGGTIIFTPSVGVNGDISWTCTGGTLIPDYRPTICRP